MTTSEFGRRIMVGERSRHDRFPGEENTEVAMIDWRKDIDATLDEARRTRRTVLLDFTAAPL
jgi:hypothetical protein